MDFSNSHQQRQILTVSSLNKNIKRLLEESFPFIWISGEISNLRIPSSGHAYFSLKDEKAQISAVVFKGQLRQMAFDLEDGITIVGLGRVGVYEPRGTYQVIFEYIEPKGAGALQLAFEQLKQKLEKQGLFDDQFKKPIPFLPAGIGVVTSPTGAVIKDILHVINRRFSNIPVDIFPVRVQGEAAVDEVVRALERACRYGRHDVLILARGGGSLEDLAPFNSERVARAIFEASIPVVTAIGHETDYTISDFVADLRAPTPSAAAEMIVPVKAELSLRCHESRNRCFQFVDRYLRHLREQHMRLLGRLVHPRKKIEQLQLYLDDLEQRGCRSMSAKYRFHRQAHDQLKLRLYNVKIDKYITKYKTKLDMLDYKLKQSMQKIISSYYDRFKGYHTSLSVLDPKAVLRRGYSIVRTIPQKRVVVDTSGVLLNQKLEVLLGNGALEVNVTKKYES